MRRGWIRIAALSCLALSGGTASAHAAAAREAPADVAAAILAALPKTEGRVAEIGPSAAARMERCEAPLAATVMGEGAYRTAQVACAIPRWTLYVEVSLVRMETVLVATRSLAMGQRLRAGDFRAIRVASNDIAGEPVSARDAIGKEVAAPLAPGETITRNQIVIPIAVRNGERIVIQWESAGVSVSAAGTALESGSIGQSILVENDASQRRVTAVILAAGEPGAEREPFIIAPR